jgi:predicted RNase H-like HicB family nuclease
MLDVATQGKTEGEVRRNIHALIDEYMKDPDTKPRRQMFYILVTI